MTKNTAHISQSLVCPRCHTRFLRKSVAPRVGKEYYCHRCHIVMGIDELVNQWNYDAGDLFPYYPVTHANYKNWIPKGNTPMIVQIDYGQQEMKVLSMLNRPNYSEFDGGEPYWDTLVERVDAYEMVNRMFLDIPEFDDYADLKETEYDALGIGVQ